MKEPRPKPRLFHGRSDVEPLRVDVCQVRPSPRSRIRVVGASGGHAVAIEGCLALARSPDTSSLRRASV